MGSWQVGGPDPKRDAPEGKVGLLDNPEQSEPQPMGEVGPIPAVA